MALAAELNGLLRQYGKHTVFVNEFKKLNWFWNQLEKDTTWVPSQPYPVHFETGEMSTFMMGGLPTAAQTKSATYASGLVQAPASLIGTMKLHQKDLKRHASTRASFLEFWPKKSKQFVKRMEEKASRLLLSDGSLCSVLSVVTPAAGKITVDRPGMLTIGEMLHLDDNDSAPVTVYVKTIDINTKEVELCSDAALTTPIDVTAYTTAQAAKLYVVQGTVEKYNSLRSLILPLSLGGSDSIHGVDKKAGGPLLQPMITSAAAANTMEKFVQLMYDFYIAWDGGGRSENVQYLCSYRNFGYIVKYLESTGRHFTKEDVSTGYGFKTIKIVGPAGDMKITVLRDCDDDFMPLVDFSALEFAGQDFFNMKHQPNGDMFYTERVSGNGGGYLHLIDVELEGQLVCTKPANLGGIHSIPVITNVK